MSDAANEQRTMGWSPEVHAADLSAAMDVGSSGGRSNEAAASVAANESDETRWFIVDRDTDAVLRGPYATAETAGAVRTEMERSDHWAERNLWIVSEAYARG